MKVADDLKISLTLTIEFSFIGVTHDSYAWVWDPSRGGAEERRGHKCYRLHVYYKMSHDTAIHYTRSFTLLDSPLRSCLTLGL